MRNVGSLTVQNMMHLSLDFPASSLKPHPSESISRLEVFLYYNTIIILPQNYHCDQMEKHAYFHRNDQLKSYKQHPTLQRASIIIYSPIAVSLVLFGDRLLGV